MIILDTDALGHIQKRAPVGVRIEAGLDRCLDRDVRITIVTTSEMLPARVRTLLATRGRPNCWTYWCRVSRR